MTATPGYVGERDLSGRHPPYIGPIFNLQADLPPGGQDFFGAYVIDPPGTPGYFALRALSATLANDEVDAFLYGDDGNGGLFEIDFFSSLQLAGPTQGPRTIFIPPVQLTLRVINGSATVYNFHASLIPDLRQLAQAPLRLGR